MRSGLVVLALGVALCSVDAEAAGCVVGKPGLERVVSAMACRSFKALGIAHSVVSYEGGVLTVSLVFGEGPALEAFSDPDNPDLLEPMGELVTGLETLTEEETKTRPTSTRVGVFSTEETSVRPRIVWARRARGKPVELIAATDGLVDRPFPRATKPKVR